MISVAACLMVCAWLWFAGAAVTRSLPAAAWLEAAAFVALVSGYWRAGRRLGAPKRWGRAAGWAAIVTTLACALAPGLEPLLDYLGPIASHSVAPAGLVSALGRAAGMDTVAIEGAVAIQDLAENHAHAVSWEQMQLPAAAALWAALALASSSRRRHQARFLGLSALIIAAWLPARVLLLERLAIDLGWLSSLWHPVIVAASFWPAAWLACAIDPPRSLRSLPRLPAAAGATRWAAAAAGMALVVFGLTAMSPGSRQQGRILIDDAHSDWEWTGIPFDRTHYGRQSTYSYVSLADFLAHHYQTVDSSQTGDLTPELLHAYDVLILKTPTRPYLETERDAIVSFVENGGGLLLISDHTNLFGMTTYINPIGAPFGIEFITDDTFDLNTGGPTSWEPPLLARHPAVAAMPPFEFETSCTIRPRAGLHPVIAGRAMGAEAADYSHVNFFGNIQPDPDERWGIFLQAASTSRGRGRVLAFSDSTVFSNFSVFFRGKPELALGMVEFLNRREQGGRIFLRALAAVGLALIVLAAAPGWRRRLISIPAAAAALAVGLIAGGLASTSANVRANPLPAPGHPLTTVVFDRVHSDYRLPTIVDTSLLDLGRNYDAFFVAIQRIHLFPRLAEPLDPKLSGARVMVILNPISLAAPEEIDRLYAWIREGGTLLVMDPERGAHAAANRFLEPSGLRIAAAFPGQGSAAGPGGVTLSGGKPVTLEAWRGGAPPKAEDVEGQAAAPPAPPLIAATDVGKGRVVAVLGSERFSAASMGPVFNNPTPIQRLIYDAEYELFEKILIPEGWQEACALARQIGRAQDVSSGREMVP